MFLKINKVFLVFKKCFYYYFFSEIKAKMQNLLPWWELTELMNYPRIWYVGEKAQSKLQPNMTNPYNYGFDKFKDLEGGIYKIVR